MSFTCLFIQETLLLKIITTVLLRWLLSIATFLGKINVQAYADEIVLISSSVSSLQKFINKMHSLTHFSPDSFFHRFSWHSLR